MLKEPVTVSFGTLYHTDNIFIKIYAEDGTFGLGEISNIEYITGVSNAAVLEDLKANIDFLVTKDAYDYKDILEALDAKMLRPSLCGIDIALFDLAAKLKKMPVHRLISNLYEEKPINYTIGICSKEETVEKMNALIAEGKNNIKIKVGANVDTDIETINYVLKNTVNSVRLDANQGWDDKDLDKFVAKVDIKRIGLIEEPFKAGEYDMLAAAQEKYPDIYFLADETVSTVKDAQELANRNAVKGFNIKLIKCGGILQAIKIDQIAKEANIQSMLGCMTETKVALSAAAHLVVASDNILACDLDAYMFFKDDGGYESDVNFGKDILTIEETIGLGIKNV